MAKSANEIEIETESEAVDENKTLCTKIAVNVTIKTKYNGRQNMATTHTYTHQHTDWGCLSMCVNMANLSLATLNFFC